MHKDLSDWAREMIEREVGVMITCLAEDQSLALAREAWINAFDKAAEELDAQIDRAAASAVYADYIAEGVGNA